MQLLDVIVETSWKRMREHSQVDAVSATPVIPHEALNTVIVRLNCNLQISAQQIGLW